MFSETTYSSKTKLIGLNLNVSEHGIGYSNLTPDPQGARGAPGVKIQVSPNQKTLLIKIVRHDKGMIKNSSAPPEELGKPAKQVSWFMNINTHNMIFLMGNSVAIFLRENVVLFSLFFCKSLLHKCIIFLL